MLLFFGLRGPQLIVVILVILLLFGTSRIPSIMRNLGKGLHSFRQGIEDAKEEMNREIKKADSSAEKRAKESNDTASDDKTNTD